MPQKPAKIPAARSAGRTFPEALAALLRKRKLKVPPGLKTAPEEAYARQPASFVQQLAGLDDAALLAHAQRVAGYAARQQERAKKAWDTSPLVREIRRRGLKEPKQPRRVVGVSFPIKGRPFTEWKDAELVSAAKEWSKLGA